MDDINRAECIYGEENTILQDKIRIKKLTVHSKTKKITLPLLISERHKNLQLYLDIFNVNGMIFLHTKTGKINFLLVKSMTLRGAK